MEVKITNVAIEAMVTCKGCGDNWVTVDEGDCFFSEEQMIEAIETYALDGWDLDEGICPICKEDN